MKLHTFDACVNGKRFRGFTRDRAGVSLKVPMHMEGAPISPYAWKYNKVIRITKGQAQIVDKILESVALGGFAVTELPPLPTKFFVFEMELDAAKIKIYSEDRNLVGFKERLTQGKLGTQGEYLSGEKEEFLGEVEIRSPEDAKRMGIEDYDGLLHRGFCIAVSRARTSKEFIEKSLLRHLNKEVQKRKLGVVICSLRVDLRKVEATKQPLTSDTVPSEVVKQADAVEENDNDRASTAMKKPAVSCEAQAPPGHPSHVVLPILKSILIAITVLGFALVVAGIVLVCLRSSWGDAEPNLFGNTFRSQNVGIASIFCGSALALLGIRRLLTTVERLGHTNQLQTGRSKLRDASDGDFEAFVVSAKGETSTKSFQDWAGGAQVTLAIVFTDVVGSTALGEEIRDEAMNEVRRAHFAQSRRLIGQFQGREIKTIGDSFMAAFKCAGSALDYTRALQENTGHSQLQISAGIHIGPMRVEEGDVFGGTVNFAARVAGAVQAAEIWLSERAKEDIDRLGAGKHKGLKWERQEGVAMKGFPGKFTLWAVGE